MQVKNLVSALVLGWFGILPQAYAQSTSNANDFAEVGWMGGVSDQQGGSGVEQAWQVYFAKEYANSFGFNLAYLNEGHFNGNYRDGVALQGEWWSPRLLDKNIGFNIGVGPYLYFNTAYNPNDLGIYQNDHGLALEASADLTLYTFDPVLFKLSIQHIQAVDSFNSNAAFVGVSWDLDKPIFRHLPEAASNECNEVIAAFGRAMVDGKPVTFSPAYSFQYHYLINSLFDTSIGYLNEGKNDLTDRQGVNAMLWLRDSFYNNHLSFEAGAGPYLFNDPENKGHTGAIIGFATNVQFTNHIFTRIEWDRTDTFNSRDSDVYTIGVGYRF